jgi:hypothetical protein
MEEKEIISQIKQMLPADALIVDYCFEGANIVLYTRNKEFLLRSREVVKEIVNQIKKRIEVRPDQSILLDPEVAKEKIVSFIPSDAEVADIWFDVKRSIVLIEADKPGLVIGKGGEIMRRIREETLWIPKVRRSPAIKSDLVRAIRATLFKNSEYRRNFLNKIGKKVYSKWSRNQKYWIRMSCLGGFREVGRSAILIQTPESRVLLDCGVNVASQEFAYPYLEVPEFDLKDLDAVIISHAHLDHSGFTPYLYKYGYKGPVYCTEPTRDIMTLLQLDYIDVVQKDAKRVIFTGRDVKEMIKHAVTLNHDEVTDVTPDIRLTLHNAGHVLGSSMVHLNIGDGYHNLLYTGDFKFSRTKLLDSAISQFQRVETLIIEGTYGAKEDIQPTRRECEEFLLKIAKDTLERGGKVLIPVLGVGRAQEVMLILEEAMRRGLLAEAPIFVDGMIWDVTAIHTTYPEFMNPSVRKLIFHRDHNPFLAECFHRVGSHDERMKVVEETGPCVVLATSGMLTGGPILTYFRELVDNPKNSMIFVSYQAEGSLGRAVQRGEKDVPLEAEGKMELVKVNLEVYTIDGLSGHSDRVQLLNFVKRMEPKPKRVIIGHGENSKCLDLASTIHKLMRVETSAPRDLDALRIR